jgi:predicted nuclease with TOPRIM domain
MDETSNNLTDQDLYGDLELAGKVAEIEDLQERLHQYEEENQRYKQELQLLQEQVSSLVKEKETLERNIVVVYNTALREIQRKDRELAELRATIVRQTLSTQNEDEHDER